MESGQPQQQEFIKWKTDVTVSCRDWVEGTKHPTKHLVAAYKKDHWLPEEGYEWVKDDKNKVKSDADGYGIVKKTRDTFYKELTKKVPDWQKTCEDPYFVSWLNQIDPNTKRLRSQLFKEAIDTSDVNKVELFFTEYLQSRTASLTRSPSTIITPSYPKFAETEKASPAPPARDSIEATSQIQTLKEIVKKDPKNLPAWVELGNLYFDTDQPKEAIEAYSRYLAVKPDNPDVRTDKGIMYRKLGEFDKAIEEFREAALSDPKHINSRYNIGLVFLHDKKDVQGAIKAWEEYLKVDPNSERAQRIKAQIEKMKTMPAPEKQAEEYFRVEPEGVRDPIK